MAALPTSLLRCRAPHPNPRRAGEPCDAPLTQAPGFYRWLGRVARLPDEGDGHLYLRCSRHSCGAVHKFEALVIEPLELPHGPPASASG